MEIKNFLTKKRIEKFKRKYKIGLCLSGGGTRGFSYIGVFKAFQEYGLKFDAVAGTSAGSLFGSLFASQIDYDEMLKRALKMKNKDFRNSTLGIMPSTMDNLANVLYSTLPYKRIEDMPTEFHAVAVDIKTGKEIDFSSGEIVPIVCGSCAIPGVFYPVSYDGKVLVDGGVTNNIPADVLRRAGCDFVITIDCNSTRGGGTTSKNVISQFMASIGVMTKINSQKGIELSDIVIRPDLKKFSSLKVEGKEEMIEEGYRATIEMMPEIKNMFMGKYKKNLKILLKMQKLNKKR